MKFSVIIPVYNVEEYLEECVDSILNQTYENWEMLLINDGSTDRSGAICDAYRERYPDRIQVRHQENQGLVKTRYTGIQSASSDVCVFVDSDDCMRQDALEKIHEAFEKTGCDVVMYRASRDLDFSSEVYNFPSEAEGCFEGASKRKIYFLLVESGKLNNIWLKAAKKTVYDRFLQDYDTDVDIADGEDLYLSMPLLTHAEKIAYLADKLYFYRRREGSMVNSFSPKLHRSIKRVRMEMEKYIALWGIQECLPVFYTSIVRNWIAALKKLLKNQRNMDRKEVASILRELSEDDFFQKAYRNMQPSRLSKRDAILANWLFRGKFFRLRVTGEIYTFLR